MHLRENVNFVKREQKMTDLLGHSNIFATLSVTNSQLYIVKYRGRQRDNIWIFLQTCKEARLLFAHTYL